MRAVQEFARERVILVSPIDPALFERADLRAALAGHDIGAVYRALQDRGISQRRIAALTGQSQSEVADGLMAFLTGSAYQDMIRT